MSISQNISNPRPMNLPQLPPPLPLKGERTGGQENTKSNNYEFNRPNRNSPCPRAAGFHTGAKKVCKPLQLRLSIDRSEAACTPDRATKNFKPDRVAP